MNADYERQQPGFMVPNWKNPADYLELLDADANAIAWEWLRRDASYRRAWDLRSGPQSHQFANARLYGLERFEDPNLPVPVARPIWTSTSDPHVLHASIFDLFPPPEDRIDLRMLAPLITVAVDETHTEHLLFSDGRRSLRLDILEGSLIGCPCSLRYELHGFGSTKPTLSALKQLTYIVGTGTIAANGSTQAHRERWVLELRTADALAKHANQQDIARTFFGDIIGSSKWRQGSLSARARVQRLVKVARLKSSSHGAW